MSDLPQYSQAIKTARKSRGLTQKVLAERIEVSSVSMCNIEKGKRFPSLMLLQRIADTLNYNLIIIFEP